MKAIGLTWVACKFAAAMAVSLAVPKSCLAAGAADTAPARPVSKRSIYQLNAIWTDDRGQPMTLASLRGRPVVLAMFYTDCENACPIIVGEMKRIRDALPGDLRGKTCLVLVSFDSERDSPEVLLNYRNNMHLGNEYVMLKGKPEDIRELAMVLGVKYARDARGQFAHSNLISILNSEGEIEFQRVGLTGDISAAVKALTIISQ